MISIVYALLFFIIGWLARQKYEEMLEMFYVDPDEEETYGLAMSAIDIRLSEMEIEIEKMKASKPADVEAV